MNQKFNSNIRAHYFQNEKDYENWKEVYITLRVDEAVTDGNQISDCFTKLYKKLNKENINILQEKIYGIQTDKTNLLSIRNISYEKSFGTTPVAATLIEGRPCIDGIFAGIQIIGIIVKNETCKVTPINFNDTFVGTMVENDLFKQIYISGISAFFPPKKDKTNFELSLSKQVKSMFYSTKKIMNEYGFNIDQLIRTWIYFPRILDWYDEFNIARTECFKELGFISKSKDYLPASTGIQGKRTDNEECFMDVLGITPLNKDKVNINFMNNTRQNEAKEYGSSFSRGIALHVENSSTLYISGTASINNQGKTIYQKDCQGQLMETLLDVAALLETEQASLKDIVLATAYCKNELMYEKFLKMEKHLSLDKIPFVPIYADVCRDDLLFEMDAIAVRTSKIIT